LIKASDEGRIFHKPITLVTMMILGAKIPENLISAPPKDGRED
jgi:hypothetical protein